MEYQDELEQNDKKEAEEEEGSDSDTDWSRVAKDASTMDTSRGSGGRRRGGRTYRGGVRKRYSKLLFLTNFITNLRFINDILSQDGDN